MTRDYYDLVNRDDIAPTESENALSSNEPTVSRSRGPYTYQKNTSLVALFNSELYLWLVRVLGFSP